MDRIGYRGAASMYMAIGFGLGGGMLISAVLATVMAFL
jgi:hypothetical protein